MCAHMPITHAFYKKYKVVVVSWEGVITDQDLVPSYSAAYASPNWQPGLSEISDLRNADMSVVTIEGLRDLSNKVEPFYKGVSHNTAVVSPEDLSYGFSRFYEMMRIESVENLRAFRELASAIEWLGIDKAFLQEIS